jgi:hypothetical protein
MTDRKSNKLYMPGRFLCLEHGGSEEAALMTSLVY